MFVGTACNMLMHKCFCQNYRKLPPVIITSWGKTEMGQDGDVNLGSSDWSRPLWIRESRLLFVLLVLV